MSDHPSKEFQEFTDLVDELLKVPKSALHNRMAAHRASVNLNDSRPGPKRKPKPAHPIASRSRAAQKTSR